MALLTYLTLKNTLTKKLFDKKLREIVQMCPTNTSCGKFTYNDLARRVAFSKRSVVRKLTTAKDLPAPTRIDTKAGFELRFCSIHLKYLAVLEAERF